MQSPGVYQDSSPPPPCDGGGEPTTHRRIRLVLERLFQLFQAAVFWVLGRRCEQLIREPGIVRRTECTSGFRKRGVVNSCCLGKHVNKQINRRIPQSSQGVCLSIVETGGSIDGVCNSQVVIILCLLTGSSVFGQASSPRDRVMGTDQNSRTDAHRTCTCPECCDVRTSAGASPETHRLSLSLWIKTSTPRPRISPA